MATESAQGQLGLHECLKNKKNQSDCSLWREEPHLFGHLYPRGLAHSGCYLTDLGWLTVCSLHIPPPSYWLHHMYSSVWKGMEILRVSHHCLTLCLQALPQCFLCMVCPMNVSVPLVPISAELREGKRTFKVYRSPGYMSMVTCSFNPGWGF